MTHLVTVEALDEDGGSGLDQVVTATGNPAGDYQAYTGPFIPPAGAGCVHAYVTDRAGNGATDSACLTWLPLLMR